jgi:hypothetical protein
MNIKVTIVIAIVLIAGLSTATGLAVHHNDQTNNTHAMMMSDAMEKTAIKKAESSAAMKQKESDEMAEHDSMMNSSSSTDSMSSTN